MLMNRFAITTGFLGQQRNRFMHYQDQRPFETRVEMASRVEGCDGLELCYPEDFSEPEKIKPLLDRHNFGVSAMNFRSRRPGQWMRGAWTSESKTERREAVDEFKRLLDIAADMGIPRVTNCPLNDGSDYLFELDYIRAYDYAAECFAELAAHNPAIRICIEYKENEPRSRCLFGLAGEAVAFCQMVGADNLGITLDMGHALCAGERPAQSAALIARAQRLFYVQVNDNDGRFDWDMLPGSMRMWDTVEFFYYLRRLGYDDDWYSFDVIPKEHDPVENFTATFELTRKLEAITDRIDTSRMEALLRERNPSRTIPYLYSLI
jgi:xylose isomerase